ncbi:hypothetical protein KAFR_0D02600 [Kazachstania africana CBS 2517]|uniref:RRM domain-containing protein n=1 Tax=Kazachstania africana (strain ATCC 22294 / BCRC 22015 / CBS 2517 / CECT 1963 / NBRC 1671 / NRRL Y-8276) TaxID=1071382 RepID=H2AU57_KAZAF|nr:hypothetical protein KAFR_0D02600 [Kazachstania africana CBS 2517]CCF57907.1 hypothetical protein KAFR_0D02600 [Kazachstania africana CBS 2517]
MTTTIKTLHVSNVPSRPQNKSNFIKLILKNINPSNKYVSENVTLPENKLNSKIALLDETNGIISISKSKKLPNQCFITFTSNDLANQFMTRFQNSKINGNVISITFAKHDSLIGISAEDKRLLGKILKKRQSKKLRLADEDVARAYYLKRIKRRTSYKLRKKGLSEEEIAKIVTETLQSLQDQQLSKAMSSGPLKKTKKKDETKVKPVNISENPPNKVLLVQNLPANVKQEDVINLFQNAGLVEVRLVSPRHLAFVEYKTVEDSSAIKDKLGHSYNWLNKTLIIGFAK